MFDEDPIKKLLLSGKHIPHDMSMGNYMASKSYVNRPVCPKMELVKVKEFIAVLITCKSDNDLIKNEIAIVMTTFTEV